MGILQHLKDMHTGVTKRINPLEDLILAAVFPIATRLIAQAPFTYGEYALAYVCGVIIMLFADIRLGLRSWGEEQFWRRLKRRITGNTR